MTMAIASHSQTEAYRFTAVLGTETEVARQPVIVWESLGAFGVRGQVVKTPRLSKGGIVCSNLDSNFTVFHVVHGYCLVTLSPVINETAKTVHTAARASFTIILVTTCIMHGPSPPPLPTLSISLFFATRL